MPNQNHILHTEQPFAYKELKDGKVQITYQNKPVKTIQGKEYTRFQKVLALNDPYELQLFMAKTTGQFKRGNERAID